MIAQPINRETLLHQLESVQPGLSTREIIEQSSCFVFKNGFVRTFNDEIACYQKCEVFFEGAVKAEPLLAILRKLNEEEILISQEEGELVVEGKRRKAGIRCEKDIQLPVDKVEKPGEWTELHEDWVEAVTIVQHCASHDQKSYEMTCIHIHPNYIEACDNFQVTRFKLPTGVKSPTLVRAQSLKHVPTLGMTKFSETATWIHFRNNNGLVFSCRRGTEVYQDMMPILKMTGTPITIPKGLFDAADKASVFANDTSDNGVVTVEIRPGKLRVKGVGALGWFQEIKKVKYDGPDLAFTIQPELLMEISKRHNEAEIIEGRLKVDGGKWRYVSCLGKIEEEKK
jgi:DNA polymerase III sliding clamp (beta) subunit (PCNA family)